MKKRVVSLCFSVMALVMAIRLGQMASLVYANTCKTNDFPISLSCTLCSVLCLYTAPQCCQQLAVDPQSGLILFYPNVLKPLSIVLFLFTFNNVVCGCGLAKPTPVEYSFGQLFLNNVIFADAELYGSTEQYKNTFIFDHSFWSKLFAVARMPVGCNMFHGDLYLSRYILTEKHVGFTKAENQEKWPHIQVK